MMNREDLITCSKHPGGHRGFLVCRHMFEGAAVHVWSREGTVVHCSKCDCRKPDFACTVICECCLDETFPELLAVDHKFPDEPVRIN